MGQHTSFFVMRFVVFNYYFNRFAIMELKLQKFVTSIGFKNWFIIRVLLQKSTVDPFYGRLQDHRLLWIMSRTCASSLTLICPGAEALVAAPKVRAEPKVSPARRLTTPVPAMDMVMIGRSANCSDISSVALKSVSTSCLFLGITAIFGISAP